jgi:GxxExxY protein
MSSNNLLYEDLTYQIRGAIFKVYNTLGFGYKESVYHNALAIELGKLRLSFREQARLDVLYEGIKVGTYIPDFVVGDKILIEIKALPFLARESEVQMVYYLKGTGYNLGLLINFGAKELEIKRKVWSNYPRQSVINPR